MDPHPVRLHDSSVKDTSELLPNSSTSPARYFPSTNEPLHLGFPVKPATIPVSTIALHSNPDAVPHGSHRNTVLDQEHLHLTSAACDLVQGPPADNSVYVAHQERDKSMELLARERAAEQNVQYRLKARDEPIASLLQAFEEYRHACRDSIFADFENEVMRKGRVLWLAHTEGKKYFHSALVGLRKQPGDHHVALRQLVKFYLQFIKDSQRFYREYIRRLSSTFGGIPELEAVAHQVKNEATGESSPAPISPALRESVLQSSHQSLIYLGDLSRYRASEQLDKNPDFGPAVGYYGLACTLVPSSGLGHHQLAVVALEQRQHLRAIYHLYRAMVVENPHPNAGPNLKREFVKTNTAWDRGELIQKGSPNDPETSTRMLVGWFVRLHSMCFDGEPFRGFGELENEVLGQLAAEVKQRPLDSTLIRMVMVNLAAQYNAGENFQRKW